MHTPTLPLLLRPATGGRERGGGAAGAGPGALAAGRGRGGGTAGGPADTGAGAGAHLALRPAREQLRAQWLGQRQAGGRRGPVGRAAPPCREPLLAPLRPILWPPIPNALVAAVSLLWAPCPQLLRRLQYCNCVLGKARGTADGQAQTRGRLIYYRPAGQVSRRFVQECAARKCKQRHIEGKRGGIREPAVQEFGVQKADIRAGPAGCSSRRQCLPQGSIGCRRAGRRRWQQGCASCRPGPCPAR